MENSYINKKKLLDFIPKNPITRFAPSPTGYLHLGHVISMIYVFGIAEIIGAKVLLRIEDHDGERSRKEYEQAILDDMAWLGFVPHNWEEFTIKKSTSYRQSDCRDMYENVLDNLWKNECLYCCECSRKKLSIGQTDQFGDTHETAYSEACRQKKLPLEKEYGVRVKVDNTIEKFNDFLLGPQTQTPKLQCGDFLIKDRRDNFTYNFCVVVDDISHGINFIVRGNDILHCTGRQIALSRLLGVKSSISYFHHPLLIGHDGKKLSKRFFFRRHHFPQASR